MKSPVLALLLALTLLGCGTDAKPQAGQQEAACASARSLGHWSGNNVTDTLTITADCVVISTGCNGRYVLGADHGNGTIDILVTQSSGGLFYCPVVGSHTCAFNDQNTGQLAFDCGGGPANYVR